MVSPPGRSAAVVVMPNCLRGFADAVDVGQALAEGVCRRLPDTSPTVLPLADGGDGTLDILAMADRGAIATTSATDAFGTVRRVRWLDSGAAAFVETAGICGLGDRTPREVRPLEASSAGVGEVIAYLAERGTRTIHVGLGGTAVLDGGAGALGALGAVFTDRAGRRVDPVVPDTLARAVRVDLGPAQRRLRDVRLELLADVHVPLTANIDHFGAQKGVTEQNRPVIAAALRHLVDLLADAQPHDHRAAEIRANSHRPWFGAGGGIGLGLSAVAPVRARSGAHALLDLVDTEHAVDRAAVAITAEGKVDDTTWLGKLPGTIAERRATRELHTAIVAIHFADDEPRPFTSHHPVACPPPPGQALRGRALRDALAGAAEQACMAAAETEMTT
jgi:glycerate 2-kinase